MRMLGAFEMAAKYKTGVKIGYDLAAEALYYITDKLSSTRNDDDHLKVKSELVKQGLDVHIEEWRDNAKDVCVKSIKCQIRNYPLLVAENVKELY